MHNKVLLGFNIVLFVLGIYLSNIFVYGDKPDLTYGGYIYAVLGLLFFISAIMYTKLQNNIKIINSIVTTLYVIYGTLMALICFYASPTDKFEVEVAVLFFAGAMLAGSTLSFQKKILDEKVSISLPHKIVRVVLLSIAALMALRLVYGIVIIGLSMSQY